MGGAGRLACWYWGGGSRKAGTQACIYVSGVDELAGKESKAILCGFVFFLGKEVAVRQADFVCVFSWGSALCIDRGEVTNRQACLCIGVVDKWFVCIWWQLTFLSPLQYTQRRRKQACCMYVLAWRWQRGRLLHFFWRDVASR